MNQQPNSPPLSKWGYVCQTATELARRDGFDLPSLGCITQAGYLEMAEALIADEARRLLAIAYIPSPVTGR